MKFTRKALRAYSQEKRFLAARQNVEKDGAGGAVDFQANANWRDDSSRVPAGRS